MEYYTRLIQNFEKSQSYALVELSENGHKYFKIINYDNIISKHNVMRLEIPVMVVFEDRLVRKAIIKSISDMIDRLEFSKNEFEDPKKYEEQRAKRERQDDDTQKGEKPAKKRKLSQPKKQSKTKKKL